MKAGFFGVWIWALAICLAGCSTPTVSNVEGARLATVGNGNVEDYRLGVGDKVRVIVYNEAALSGEFEVNANGYLSIPLIGDVKAIGKSTQDTASLIEAGLGNGYLRNPKVSVEVLTYRPFFILGEVKTPGQYPYASGLTILNAVATAEGFTPRAQRKVVFIRRSGETDEKAYQLSPDLRVLPGDTIRIGERYF